MIGRASSVAAFLAALTTAELAHAFRTSAALPELSGTEKVRFAEETVEYELFETGAPGVALADARSDILGAFTTWSEPTCSSLRLNYNGLTPSHAIQGDNRNTIEWITADWEGLGFEADAAAVTDVQYLEVPGTGWVIAEADIYLNAVDHTWAASETSSDATRDILSVLTHEVGHFLGLLHPCEPGGAEGAPDCESDPAFSETTMYPFYDPGQSTLSPDDEAGLCFLYPNEDCSQTGCPSGLQCTPEGCREPCGSEFCSLGQVCIADQCEQQGTCETGSCEPETCVSTADCTEPNYCFEGRCTRGPAVTGDPCSADGDCAEGRCINDGYCVVPCSTDAQCGSGERCDASLEPAACIGKQPFGATCTEADECVGAECLAGAGKSAVCTRTCGGEHAACPLGWDCSTVEARQVCVPPELVSPKGAGCGCSLAGRDLSLAPLFAILGLVAMAARRSSHRRKRVSSSLC